MSNDFSVFICLANFSSISDELKASENHFEQFVQYHCLLTLPVCFFKELTTNYTRSLNIFSVYIVFLLNMISFCT